MDGKDPLWYSHYISDLDHHDLSSLQSNLGLDATYELRLPMTDEHPSSPPEGFITVFKDQVVGCLRFPLHHFLSELSQYCGIGISQLFHHFYSFRRAEAGVFNVQAKPGQKLFDDLPSSNKGWRSRFFFLKPPSPLTGPSQWRSFSASDLPSHVHEPACSAAAVKLSGVVVRLSVLMLEGILHAFGLSPVPTEIGAPFVPAILRSFASQETPAVAVLQTLNEELTQGLPSAPAVAGLQLSEPRTSEAEDAPMLIEPPALSLADSALPRIADQPAAEPSPAKPVSSLPPTMKLRLMRKGKRTAPATATSPPPLRRQRVEKASDLEVTDPPLDLAVLVTAQNILPAPPSSSGDQPPDLLLPSASPPLAPPSSATPTPNLPSTDPAFEALWRLPSETDLACTPAADSSPIFGRVNFYGDLAISWQSASQQFWESGSPLGEFDQIARSLVATCSASLSAVQRATELQRENAALKARLQELEHPAASSAPPEPSLGSLDAYLRAVGESATSARAISHAAFDKLQQLEAALKTSESSLASEVDRRQASVSELKDKEAELLSQSEELTLLRQGQELLQMRLADAQALASVAAARETTMRAKSLSNPCKRIS
ncbi:uncharacterized protein LOC121991266 [Zingiber officinale]|uniref:uncharacterized protein LOC121991266 n=1 Tax=Zingiber officinale TaxID=94328 RepID=UPI001C4D6025|nr:uncharacterized protein LOC121991266 [Zingiber officinale]